MSGGIPSKKGRSIFSARRRISSSDECEIQFTVDLIGVRRTVAAGLEGGDMLRVTLVTGPSAVSAVCLNEQGEAVGSLAAFPGVAQFLACLERGFGFEAVVEGVGPTHCRVTVARTRS